MAVLRGNAPVRHDEDVRRRDASAPRLPARRRRLRGHRRRGRARSADCSACGPLSVRDFCAGTITAIAVENGNVTSSGNVGVAVPAHELGVDALARVYALSLSGDVYRLDPK